MKVLASVPGCRQLSSGKFQPAGFIQAGKGIRPTGKHGGPMASTRVLIIEDDADINNIVATHLTRAGYTCTQAFSGTEE